VLPLVTEWVWVLDATVAVVGDDSVTVWVWVYVETVVESAPEAALKI
jgi:hypothetical protein